MADGFELLKLKDGIIMISKGTLTYKLDGDLKFSTNITCSIQSADDENK